MIEKGAHFRKADLHVHTPASKCFSTNERHITAVDIVEEAVKNGLEVLGIADHNDIAWIEDVRKAAQGKGIVVFPCIEVTAQEAHVLAIFDPDCTIETLGDFLPAIGITSSKRGKKDAMATSFEKVIETIEEFGGIAIAAHANSSNGLFDHTKGQYRIKMCKMPQLAALELSNPEAIRKFSMGKVPGYPPKACICGSDAHSLCEIGQSFTYIKMDVPSLTSLRQAIADWPVRVRFPWDTIEPCCPRIRSISVNQGFFGGLQLAFHSNLTCLVGGRGTGKSTILEFLRYCFNDISTIPDIKEDTHEKAEKLVGPGGRISVTYVDEDGEEFFIEREVNDPVVRDVTEQTVKDSSGENAVLPSRPVFFSQGEISRIATSPIAQLDLIDKYLMVSDENREEETLVGSLRINAESMEQQERALKALESELNDPETGKLATQAEHDRLERQLKQPIFSEYPRWEAEERFIEGTHVGLRDLQKAFRSAIDDINVGEYFPPVLDKSSPSHNLLAPVLQLPESLVEHLRSVAGGLEEQISSMEKRVKQIGDKWRPLYEAKQQEYGEVLKELGEDTKAAQKRFRGLKMRLEELEQKEIEAERTAKRIENLWKARRGLLTRLNKVRQKRFQKRVEKAKEWENALSSQINIEIVNCGDRKEYLAMLGYLLKGSWSQYRDIERVVNTVDPARLVDAVLSDQVDWLSQQSGVRQDAVGKMAEWLRGRHLTDILDLQFVELPDLPQISFQIEPGKYKPLNELSVGTKSTVIASLAMVEGNSPLVIDQPEDSLDTQFIYDHIVAKLRDQKETRQFILTSHNANIVVAGEAELTHVLSASWDKGTVKSSGGIDRYETNQLVMLHLEGGPEAFKLRAEKYIPE